MTGILSLLLSFAAEAHHGHRHPTKKKKRSKVVVVKTPTRRVVHQSVRILPRNHRVITYNRVNYYYFGNQYYILRGGAYIVVTPPKSVLVIR